MDHLLVVDSFPENDLMKKQSISPPPETAFQGNPSWIESICSMTALAPQLGLFTGVLAYDSAQDISSFLLSPGGSRIHHLAEILKMNVGTVKSGINRARKALLEKLQENRELFS